MHRHPETLRENVLCAWQLSHFPIFHLLVGGMLGDISREHRARLDAVSLQVGDERAAVSDIGQREGEPTHIRTSDRARHNQPRLMAQMLMDIIEISLSQFLDGIGFPELHPPDGRLHLKRGDVEAYFLVDEPRVVVFGEGIPFGVGSGVQVSLATPVPVHSSVASNC